jgi:hypothetical protein
MLVPLGKQEESVSRAHHGSRVAGRGTRGLAVDTRRFHADEDEILTTQNRLR